MSRNFLHCGDIGTDRVLESEVEVGTIACECHACEKSALIHSRERGSDLHPVLGPHVVENTLAGDLDRERDGKISIILYLSQGNDRFQSGGGKARNSLSCCGGSTVVHSNVRGPVGLVVVSEGLVEPECVVGTDGPCGPGCGEVDDVPLGNVVGGGVSDLGNGSIIDIDVFVSVGFGECVGIDGDIDVVVSGIVRESDSGIVSLNGICRTPCSSVIDVDIERTIRRCRIRINIICNYEPCTGDHEDRHQDR